MVVGMDVISYSGGKDSTASVILYHELYGNSRELKIIFSEVMFNENISGELPEHIHFIKNVAFPIFQSWGYETIILHDERTYMDYFNHVRQRGKNIGKRVGFPMADKCVIKNCKIRPIEHYLKTLNEPYRQIIGITYDEKTRYEKLGKGKYSILYENKYTRDDVIRLCMQYDLLSPYYVYSRRGGCWFCPNQGRQQLEYLKYNYKDLWRILLELEEEKEVCGSLWCTRNGVAIKEIDLLI